jgi:NDP-hexose C3-ketoreductase / dTDP-4-oxo-2-deoxy-alpha-D-pentos-2-ene 2,3-reductase
VKASSVMRYPYLGRTALRISSVALGTFNFGTGATDEPTAHLMLDEALEGGINLIDTADMYGDAESVIGRWIAQGNRREKIVLTTKVFSGPNDWPNQMGLSAWHIRQAAERSLAKLRTDHIDLYHLHHIDRHAPWEEIWQAMDTLIRDGKVLYVATSNFPAWSLVLGHETALRLGMYGVAADQTRYSLLERTAELEVHPACEAIGVGQLAWGVMDHGLLGGGLLDDPGEGRRAQSFNQSRASARRELVTSWEQVCLEAGHTPAEVSLAWVLHQPGVTSAIIGPRTTEQLQSSLRAATIELEPEVLARLDELFPGPGGPAPEAYTPGFPRQPLIET